MVLHVFISLLGGVPLCIPYGLYSGTSLGGTTRGTLEGYPGRVLSQTKADGLTEMTPWSDRVRASSTDRASIFLRSESLRMDETAPAASSAFDSSESSSPSAPKRSLLTSSGIEGGSSVLSSRGFQTEIGITSNGDSVALPEGPLVTAAGEERRRRPVTLGTSAKGGSACPFSWILAEDDGEDAPNLGYPYPDSSSPVSPRVFASRFASSSTMPPLEPEALPEWALQLEALHAWTS